MTYVLMLALLAGVIGLWLDGARAREIATAVADELCRRRGYQLLDGTVALARLGLASSTRGVRVKRMFRFDYSVEGVGRLGGAVVMLGSEVQTADLLEAPPEPEADSDDPAPTPPCEHADNVVPFKRRH